LLEVKRWADRGLFQAVERQFAGLSEEHATLMLRVLDHMHVVDVIFQHHLQGLPHGYAAPRSERLPDLPWLAAAAAEVDDWYVAYARSVGAQDAGQVLDIAFTSGKQLRMSRGEVLLHVCMHGTYHRGNAGALLQLKGLTPGRDAVTDYLEAHG
jgi:uncharacterized damage-inducible protein DinB